MSYFSAEDPTLGSWLGCGPGCNCGPCRSGVSGFNEWYERDEEDEPVEIRTPSPPPNQTRPVREGLSGWSWSRVGFGYYGQEEAPPTAPDPGSNPAPTPTGPEPRPTGPEPQATAPQPEPGAPAPVANEKRPTETEQSRVEADLRMIREALSRGIRNAKRITDIVFFARHPDRKGNPAWINEAGLFDEWREIRETLVLPEFRRSFRPRPRPRVIIRHRTMRRRGLHGYPGFGLGYFGAPPVCDPSRRDLNAIADDLKLINNELARGPGASAVRLTLKRQLLDSDVDGMIHALDSYIVSGCCEPSLKTLESEIHTLSWPLLVVPAKARLISQIAAAQGRARKDLKHC